MAVQGQTGDQGDLVIRRTTLLAAVCACVAVATAGATTASPVTSSAGPAFSGKGRKTLPLFRVTVGSTLHWTNSGAAFQIVPRRGTAGGAVSSTGASGATYLEPGRYRLEVQAVGTWKIRVASGIERPRSLGGGLVGFRGNGARDLPPFTTRRGTNLVWTNTGAKFEVSSNDFSVQISSRAKSGKGFMVRGRQRLTVNAVGDWTVGWKP